MLEKLVISGFPFDGVFCKREPDGEIKSALATNPKFVIALLTEAAGNLESALEQYILLWGTSAKFAVERAIDRVKTAMEKNVSMLRVITTSCREHGMHYSNRKNLTGKKSLLWQKHTRCALLNCPWTWPRGWMSSFVILIMLLIPGFI